MIFVIFDLTKKLSPPCYSIFEGGTVLFRLQKKKALLSQSQGWRPRRCMKCAADFVHRSLSTQSVLRPACRSPQADPPLGKEAFFHEFYISDPGR